jgi:hypothetical protein
VTTCHFYPSFLFVSKGGANPCGASFVTSLKWKAPSLPANIRLGWKWMVETKALAYKNVLLRVNVLIFIVQVKY